MSQSPLNVSGNVAGHIKTGDADLIWTPDSLRIHADGQPIPIEQLAPIQLSRAILPVSRWKRLAFWTPAHKPALQMRIRVRDGRICDLWAWADPSLLSMLPHQQRMGSEAALRDLSGLLVAMLREGASVAELPRGDLGAAPVLDVSGLTFVHDRAPILLGTRWGFAASDGILAIPARFAAVGAFAQQRAPATEDGVLWGYIDPDGNWAIPPAFSSANPFSKGLASVERGGAPGWIDREGQPTFSPKERATKRRALVIMVLILITGAVTAYVANTHPDPDPAPSQVDPLPPRKTSKPMRPSNRPLEKNKTTRPMSNRPSR